MHLDMVLKLFYTVSVLLKMQLNIVEYGTKFDDLDRCIFYDCLGPFMVSKNDKTVLMA